MARRVPKVVERRLDAALDRAIDSQLPRVQAYVDRLRGPGASPAEAVTRLERHYRAAVVGTGAASGGAAALPGVGTAASLATGAAEVTAFVSATALFVLALAEIHQVPVGDRQARRALVLTVLLGDAAAAAYAETGAAEAPHWAAVLTRKDRKTVGGIEGRLMKTFITRFGARQGALIAGRALPFGIGAGVGAVGNAALARATIAAARRVFGRPPDRFAPRVIDA